MTIRELPSIAHTSRPRVDGRLHLRFERDADATRLVALEQRPPLRVVRSFAQADGTAAVHLHNVSGGVLGGDHLLLRVEVGAGARAQLTTTGATRVYRSRGEATAVQINDVSVAQDGLLEYVPDTLIPFAGSRYRQRTRVELAPGAGLVWWETIAPGRVARDELFAYNLLELGLEIVADGRPIALEQLRLEPSCRSLDSPLRLGAYRYTTSLYVCRHGVAPEQWLAYEAQLAAIADELSEHGDQLWGVTTLPAHGLLVRGLSRSAPAIARGLPVFWRHARQLVFGAAPIPPRKLY